MAGALVSGTQALAVVAAACEGSFCGVKVEEYFTCVPPTARVLEPLEARPLVKDTTGAEVFTAGLEAPEPLEERPIGRVGRMRVRSGDTAAAAGVAGPIRAISTVAMPAAAVSEAIGASRRRRTGRAMRSERGTGGMDFRIGGGGVRGFDGPRRGRRVWTSAVFHRYGLYENKTRGGRGRLGGLWIRNAT